MEEECEVCHGTDPRCECDRELCSKQIFRGKHTCKGQLKFPGGYMVECPCACHAVIQQEIDKAREEGRQELINKVSTTEGLNLLENARQEERSRILKLIEGIEGVITSDEKTELTNKINDQS